MPSDRHFSSRAPWGPRQRTAQPATAEIFSEDAALRCLVSHALARDLSISGRIALANAMGAGRLCVPGPTGIIHASAALVRAFRNHSRHHVTLTCEGRLRLEDRRCLDYVVHVRLDTPKAADSHCEPSATNVPPLPLQIHLAASQLTDSLFHLRLADDNGQLLIGSGFITFGRYGHCPQHQGPGDGSPPLNRIA